MNNPKFQVFRSPVNSQFYYRLKAQNGENILNSEGYTTKQNCLAAIVSVKQNAPIDSRYERKDSSAGYTFNLKAANGEIVGRSEVYTTSTSREGGIAAVKRDAPNAPTEDLA